MTRDFTFTLTDTGKYYNLWDDLIAPLITDKTLSNSPYIPNIVYNLTLQSQTDGSYILKTDNTKIGGLKLLSSSTVPYTMFGETNCIDLKNQFIKPGANPTVFYAGIVAK